MRKRGIYCRPVSVCLPNWKRRPSPLRGLSAGRPAGRTDGRSLPPAQVAFGRQVSVTLVDCIHMAEDVVKLLTRTGSPITLVFDTLRRYQIPRGTPSAGLQNTRAVKNWRFSTEITVISEMVGYEIGSWLL